ncbi:MAG: hypothetical protein AAF570_08555, partial [Bacteroidota bacterium]
MRTQLYTWIFVLGLVFLPIRTLMGQQYPVYPSEKFKVRVQIEDSVGLIGEALRINYQILYDKDIYYPHLLEDTMPPLYDFWVEEASRDLEEMQIVHHEGRS